MNFGNIFAYLFKTPIIIEIIILGNARVILPGLTACIDCTLDLFPPQVNFPLCTIAHTPRLPEHCIEYARILLWPKENPFGDDTAIDGDDPSHITWIFEKAMERAAQYGIRGITYRLTQGVVKNIIPAVASTNAVIAAACTTEVFKVATSCCQPLNNYMVFNDADGIYTYVYEQEKNPNCLACSNNSKKLEFKMTDKLQDVIDHLVNSASYQMKVIIFILYTQHILISFYNTKFAELNRNYICIFYYKP